MTLAGCTLFAGVPWGEAAVSLSATFAPPAARLTDDGRLRTARDYALAVEELAVTVDAVTLSVGDDAGTLSFDPADPPPGYSLCHGGHCHADDGRLVAYDEIERSLAGGGDAEVLALPVTAGAVALTGEPTTLSLATCAGDGAAGEEACHLGRGTLRAVSVAMSAVEVRAVAYDLRPTAEARLPPEGVPLVARVEGAALATAALDLPLDGSDDPRVVLTVALAMSPALFDDVDLAALPRDDDGALVLDDDAAAALLEALSGSELDVDVRREPYPTDLTPVLIPARESGQERT